MVLQPMEAPVGAMKNTHQELALAESNEQLEIEAENLLELTPGAQIQLDDIWARVSPALLGPEWPLKD